MIPVGLSQATSISVGNNVGKKDTHAAKKFAFVCTLFSLGWAALSVTIMLVFDDMIINLFTES